MLLLLPVLLLSVLLLVSVTAVAQAPPVIAASSVVAVDREVYAGVDGDWSRYGENFSVGPGDRESGWVPGFGAGARWIDWPWGLPPVFIGVDYHHQSGDVTYEGTNFDTGAPLVERSGHVTDDVTGEIGPAFLLSPALVVIPVLQIGYRHWTRSLASNETEDYAHVSVGAALRVNAAVTPRLIGTLDVGIGAMVNPTIDIRFRGDYREKLGGAPVYRTGGKLDYAVAGPMHVFVSADLMRFNYGRSDGSPFGAGGTIFEPSSTTTAVTVSGGVAYGF